ncbi:MAG: flagellar basal body-associated protein FliL [Hyphomicrobiales bacterium]|nr:flagellar basal body-associated protein FliL [Hyphomicrobiales bacterium]
MAAEKSTGAKSSAGQGKGGALLPLVLLTLLAAGAGAAHGLQMFDVFRGAQKPAGDDVAATATAGHGVPPKAEGGHGAPAAGGHGGSAPPAAVAAAVKLPSKIVIRDLPPVVTNVAMPAESWVRLEASIVYDQADLPNPDVLITEISGDMLAFLRSVSLREIQGSEGLMFLRQDLKERIALRADRKIRDFVIQTLVVQ